MCGKIVNALAFFVTWRWVFVPFYTTPQLALAAIKGQATHSRDNDSYDGGGSSGSGRFVGMIER